MTETESHLSAYTLGAIAQTTRGVPQAAVQHLADCAQCQAVMDGVHEARRAFAQTVLPRTRAAVERRASRPRLPWWSALALAPALGILLVVRLPASGDGVLRAKGAATLNVFALHGDHVAPVQDGDRLRPGDRLRFEVKPAGARWLLVASIDAAGQTSVYVPFGGSASVQVGPGTAYLSPDSIVLDPVPGPERVFAFLSDQPLSVASVSPLLRQLGKEGPQSIRAAGELPVPGAVQRSLLWENAGQ